MWAALPAAVDTLAKGTDTEDVLTALDYSVECIAALRSEGTVWRSCIRT